MTTTYRVYQDGVLVDTDDASPDRIVGLTNGQTYSMRVVQVIDGVEGRQWGPKNVTPSGAGGTGDPPPDPDPDPPPVGGGGSGDPGFTTLQAAVTAAADNDTITCPPGSTFAELVTVPPATTGLIIDLNGSTVTGSNARKQWFIGDNTVDLQVINGTFENAKSGDGLPGSSGDFQLASFQANGATGLRLNNVRLTGGCAANFGMQGGSDLQITNSEIDHARVEGLSFGGVSTVLIDGCHIHHNNPAGLGQPANEAGGIKCGNHAGSIVISNNEVDHNDGPGIWIDVFGFGVTINNNDVHHNSNAGIMFEVSGYSNDSGAFGAASRIHHNNVWENGWQNIGFPFAGILVSSAANVEVDHNTTAWNRNEFVVFEQARPIPPANSHNFDVKSVNHHDNVHALGVRTLVSGEYPAVIWWGRSDSGPIFTNPGNVGANNQFWAYLPSGTYALFQTNSSGIFTDATFNATQMGGGSTTRISSGARDTALTAAGIPLAPEAH